MDENQQSLIAQAILEVTGVAVHVTSPQTKDLRRSLAAHISGEGYTSQNGPRFSIRPHGLKRHCLKAEMGNFAAPCIKLIQSASAEQLATARTIISQLASEPQTEVRIHPNQDLETWTVCDSGFAIEIITVSEGKPDSDEAVTASATKFMAPMLAVFGELIGYENPEEPDDTESSDQPLDVEGQLTTAIVRKRERSRRNRLLCLAIHGHKCFVCGKEPHSIYPGLPSIIEVHHIEPVSTLAAPKVYDPKTDLIPLCPCCHRAIHKKFPAMLPEELKALISNQG
jgi:5-methylcytosine-specific restriction protein A